MPGSEGRRVSMGKRPPVARDGQELPTGPQSPVRCPRRGADPGGGGLYFERGIVSLQVPFRRLPRPHRSPHPAAPPRVMTSSCPVMPRASGRSGSEPPPPPTHHLPGEVWRRITSAWRCSAQGSCWARGAADPHLTQEGGRSSAAPRTWRSSRHQPGPRGGFLKVTWPLCAHL